MNYSKQKELTIFFTTLVVIAIIFIGGVKYFQSAQGLITANPSGLLADIGATPTPPQDETTSTSTIVIVNDTSTATFPSSTPSKASTTPVTPIKPLILPYSFNAVTASTSYWPKAWGALSFTKNSLVLLPDPSYHGANSFLNGASSWTNYAVNANVSWLMGGSFNIVARVASGTQNFVYCEFGPNGTEIIERVNGADTQIASASASTTANMQGRTENFGMKVYGSDIICTMNNQEVLGASVHDNNEVRAGGIGFVIFGAPAEQNQVEVSEIYVSAHTSNTLVVPFPVAVAPIIVLPPNPAPTPIPPPTPTPKPVATTTAAKTLPYFANTFAAGDGWGNYWGTFTETPDALTIGSSKSSGSGGAFLDGTSQWNNYTFTAGLDWTKGEFLGLYARHTDNNNYVECVFDRRFLGNVRMSLQQVVNGHTYTLTQTDLPGYNQPSILNFPASIKVQDTVGTCIFDGHPITNAFAGNTLAPPYSGKIGLTTWDPGKNNSEIIVKNISVESNY